jgi:DNA polymerase-3 subunit epsilon
MRLSRARAGAAARFRDAGQAAASTPWREARWCAVDLELTGLDVRRNEIIALGAVPIEDGRVVLGEALYRLARPSARPDHGAVLTHKLRLADLIHAPPVDDAIELLLDLLAGRVPVFHTAVVERTFLGPQFASRRVRLPNAADTEQLGLRWLHERDGVAPAGLSLARLARELGQPAESPHHALGDALTTAQAFIALATHLDGRDPQTVGSLLRVPRPAGARRFGPG